MHPKLSAGLIFSGRASCPVHYRLRTCPYMCVVYSGCQKGLLRD